MAIRLESYAVNDPRSDPGTGVVARVAPMMREARVVGHQGSVRAPPSAALRTHQGKRWALARRPRVAPPRLRTQPGCDRRRHSHSVGACRGRSRAARPTGKEEAWPWPQPSRRAEGREGGEGPGEEGEEQPASVGRPFRFLLHILD